MFRHQLVKYPMPESDKERIERAIGEPVEVGNLVFGDKLNEELDNLDKCLASPSLFLGISFWFDDP